MQDGRSTMVIIKSLVVVPIVALSLVKRPPHGGLTLAFYLEDEDQATKEANIFKDFLIICKDSLHKKITK